MQASYKQDTRDIRQMPLKDRHTHKETPQYEEKSMQERLTRCLQLLKINYNDNQISKTAFKLIEKAIHKQIAKKPRFGRRRS